MKLSIHTLDKLDLFGLTILCRAVMHVIHISTFMHILDGIMPPGRVAYAAFPEYKKSEIKVSMAIS